jgi:hypothetical protein
MGTKNAALRERLTPSMAAALQKAAVADAYKTERWDSPMTQALMKEPGNGIYVGKRGGVSTDAGRIIAEYFQDREADQ